MRVYYAGAVCLYAVHVRFRSPEYGCGQSEAGRLGTALRRFHGLCVGLLMCVLTFFHGDLMAALFSSDAAVIAAAHSYLKAYAIDCLLTSFSVLLYRLLQWT